MLFDEWVNPGGRVGCFVGMTILTILSILLIAALVYMYNQWKNHRMPSKRRRAQVLATVKQEMEEWSPPLVKMHKEELDLFSLTQAEQVIKTSGAGKKARGTFTTIFQEPVLSYSYRRFLGKKVNELLYARTADHEYVYWTDKGKTSLLIDDQPVGTIKDKTLIGQKTGKELAHIAQQPVDNYLPVRVGNREVGSLTQLTAEEQDGLSQRAFEFIPDDLSEREEQLLMGLAVRELVGREV